MKTSVLDRQQDYFNPYFFEGKQIEKIIFFNSSGEIGSVKWFGSNNKYHKLEIPCEIVNKRKVDFTHKGAFICKGEHYRERVNFLYVNINNFDHTEPTEKQEATRNQISLYNCFTLKFRAKGYSYIKDDTNPHGFRIEREAEFKTVEEEVKSFVSREESKHKKQLNKFIEQNALSAEHSETVYNTLKAVGMLTELDNV